MTESEKINISIAKYFGFKVSKGKQYLINGLPQWTYPDDWYMAQGGIPNTEIPDFLQILEDYMRLMKKHGAFGEREYFGRLGDHIKPYPRDEVTEIRAIVKNGQVCIIMKNNQEG